MEFLIQDNDINKRIDAFLVENMTETRNFIQKSIDNNDILVNNESTKKNYRLRLNDKISILQTQNRELDIVAENIPLDIVFEDEDIIVINKQKDFVVHPAPGHSSGTLVNALMYHCKDSLSGINGDIRPGIVHRIDKDTTGLLVVAKNDKAHISLSEQIKAHTAGRVYHAIVFGTIKDDFGVITKPIGRHTTDRKKMSTFAKVTKDAVTHYKVLARFPGFTYVECILETGRTHQIRVHMQSIGHPIIGDFVYTNMKTKFGLYSQCLHAKELTISHPKNNETLTFVTELPEYFQKILSILNQKA